MSWFLVCLIITLNIADDILTEIALHHMPNNLKAKEDNPIQLALMKKSRILQHFVKHGGLILLLILLFTWLGDLNNGVLVILAFMFLVVVANNAYIVLMRHFTRRKYNSPLVPLMERLHIKEKYTFIFFIIITSFLGAILSSLITYYEMI